VVVGEKKRINIGKALACTVLHPTMMAVLDHVKGKRRAARAHRSGMHSVRRVSVKVHNR